MNTSANTSADHSSLATRRLSHILAVFRRHGMRLTQVRRRAIQQLCSATAPLTVQQLHELVARDQPSDLSTTYRFVNDLAENGVVKAVQIGGQTVPGYIVHLPGESNDFVACVSCGSLTWLDDLAELRALERRLATQMHFRGLTHELTLRGQCEPCQGKQPVEELQPESSAEHD